MTQQSDTTRSRDQLETEQLKRLKALAGADYRLDDLSDLAQLPVIRKDQLLQSQIANPPFGLLAPKANSHIFQSPGPLYEPGLAGPDPWRFGRFLQAIGVGKDDVVQNTFAYHFTPAGAMFESAASAVDAVVFPAGPGNTRQQCEVAQTIATTVYAGTPDFLAVLLKKADEEGFDLSRIRCAAVSAGPLFPQLRQSYADRGILCRQCYGTADVGLIAYETADCTEGMFIDDDVILEVVSPGTGNPLPVGEIGEVVVTVLSEIHPIIRFSVGDLSAFMPDSNEHARKRIVGWRGRADQATKVKGMFIRPEQVSELVSRHDAIDRARVEVSSDGTSDQIEVKLETNQTDAQVFSDMVRESLKLRADITLVERGALPRDGILVADLRQVPGE
jgi:phenylacetate-CoA ligase